MTLQDIVDHLAACVTDMNDNSEHDIAFKAQAAILAVNALQAACCDYGIHDEIGVGDWPITTQADRAGVE